LATAAISVIASSSNGLTLSVTAGANQWQSKAPPTARATNGGDQEWLKGRLTEH